MATKSTPAKPKVALKKAPAKKLTVKAKKPTKPSHAKPTRKSPASSKQSQLIALLKSPSGATIEQMTRLTGWQAHTVRGTISGVLRKRMSLSVDSATNPVTQLRTYRIVGTAA